MIIRNLFYLSLIVMFLSITYYFAIYIPQRDKDKLEYQETVRIETDKAIGNCLDIAKVKYQADWNKQCEVQNLGYECNLPNSVADRVQERHSQLRDDCYQRFK